MKFPTCCIPREQSEHWNLPPGAAQVQNTCSQWNTHLFSWEAPILCVSYICLTFPGEDPTSVFGVIGHPLIRDTTSHLLERTFLDHVSLINDTEPVCALLLFYLRPNFHNNVRINSCRSSENNPSKHKILGGFSLPCYWWTPAACSPRGFGSPCSCSSSSWICPQVWGLLAYFCSLWPTNLHIPFNLHPLGLKHDMNGPTQFTYMIAPIPEPRSFLSS